MNEPLAKRLSKNGALAVEGPVADFAYNQTHFAIYGDNVRSKGFFGISREDLPALVRDLTELLEVLNV